MAKVKAKFDSRHLQMVPDFSFGSITHDGLSALYPGISEGLWAQDEPFTVKVKSTGLTHFNSQVDPAV
jgi:hypothetical protein